MDELKYQQHSTDTQIYRVFEMTHENYITDSLATLTDEDCAELDWSTRSDAPYRDTGYGEGLMFSCFALDQWDEEQQQQQQEEDIDQWDEEQRQQEKQQEDDISLTDCSPHSPPPLAGTHTDGL